VFSFTVAKFVDCHWSVSRLLFPDTLPPEISSPTFRSREIKKSILPSSYNGPNFRNGLLRRLPLVTFNQLGPAKFGGNRIARPVSRYRKVGAIHRKSARGVT